MVHQTLPEAPILPTDPGGACPGALTCHGTLTHHTGGGQALAYVSFVTCSRTPPSGQTRLSVRTSASRRPSRAETAIPARAPT